MPKRKSADALLPPPPTHPLLLEALAKRGRIWGEPPLRDDWLHGEWHGGPGFKWFGEFPTGARPPEHVDPRTPTWHQNHHHREPSRHRPQFGGPAYYHFNKNG
jgi:hypothetical protein